MNSEEAKIKTKENRIKIINYDPNLKNELDLILDAIEKQIDQGLSFLHYRIIVCDMRIIQHLKHDLGYTISDEFLDYLDISWFE